MGVTSTHKFTIELNKVNVRTQHYIRPLAVCSINSIHLLYCWKTGPTKNTVGQYKLWALAFFMWVRCMLPLSFSASPLTAASHHAPPNSHTGLLWMKVDTTQLYCASGALWWQAEELIFSSFPWRGSSLGCPPAFYCHHFSFHSGFGHWFHVQPLTFPALLLLRDLRKLFLLPAPNPLHLCSIWGPKPSLMEADKQKGSCTSSFIRSTGQKSHAFKGESGIKSTTINLGSLKAPKSSRKYSRNVCLFLNL